jgi:hypothetical protein
MDLTQVWLGRGGIDPLKALEMKETWKMTGMVEKI